MSDYDVEMVKEASAFVEAVNDKGITSSYALAAYARLRNVYDGKPAEGKWARWAEEKDRREGIIP